MQIDTAKVAKLGKLTDDERVRLRKQGGCFFCREAGHMARDCKIKKRVLAQNSSEDPQPRARKAETTETNAPAPSQPTVKGLHAQIRALTRDKREKLLDKLIDEGSEDEEELKSQADQDF